MDQAGHCQSRVDRQIGIIAVNRHTQLGGDIGHLDSDGAQANYAQRFAHQLRAHKLALSLFYHLLHVGPCARLLPQPGRAGGDLPGCKEKGAHGQLLYGVGIGAGRIEDHNPRLRTALNRDIVGTRARPCNCPQGLRKGVLMHVGGADQDAVLILHRVGHLVAALVQHRQAGRRNLIQRLDTEHRCSLLN